MCVVVERARECRPKTDQVGATLHGIDVVGERKYVFDIPIVVLHCDFDFDDVLFGVNVDRFFHQRLLGLVDILDERDYASAVLEVVSLWFFRSLVFQYDFEFFV